MREEVHLKYINVTRGGKIYVSNHLHHHFKTIFSKRVILWEGASIEDEEIKLCVKQEKLSCCPLYTCQAGHNLLLTWYLDQP